MLTCDFVIYVRCEFGNLIVNFWYQDVQFFAIEPLFFKRSTFILS